MTKEPEQMLVQDSAAAFIGQSLTGRGEEDIGEIEAGAAMTVKQQQDKTRQQYGEGQNTQDSCKEQRPDSQRQTRHAHAFRTHIQDSRDIVQTPQKRRDYEHGHGYDPEVHTRLRSFRSIREGA